MENNQKKKPEYDVLRVDVLKDLKDGLIEKQKENGNRTLSDFLRPFLNRIVSGQIKI